MNPRRFGRAGKAVSAVVISSFVLSPFAVFAEEELSAEQPAESVISSDGGVMLMSGGGEEEPTKPQEFLLAKPPRHDAFGALLLAHEFTIPPGRNNLTPHLAVVYNSNARVSSGAEDTHRAPSTRRETGGIRSSTTPHQRPRYQLEFQAVRSRIDTRHHDSDARRRGSRN